MGVDVGFSINYKMTSGPRDLVGVVMTSYGWIHEAYSRNLISKARYKELKFYDADTQMRCCEKVFKATFVPVKEAFLEKVLDKNDILRDAQIISNNEFTQGRQTQHRAYSR